MKHLKRLKGAIGIVALFATVATVAAILSLQLMPTQPQSVCKHDGHTTAWCTLDDMKPAEKAAGMVDAIKGMIDRAQTPEDKIYIGYFSFSNKPVFRALCEKGKLGVQIEGFFDFDYSGPDQLPSQLVSQCQGAQGNNVKVYFLGQKDESQGIWRLHHNKFLIVEPKDQDLDINFSSGNLSAFGTSLHFDHWVHLQTPPTSLLAQSHQCVLQALRKAQGQGPNGIDDPDVYINEVRNCRNQKKLLNQAQSIAQEGVYLVTSPNDDDAVYMALKKEINGVINAAQSNPTAYSIHGAIQHFLHSGVASDLKRACQMGIDVRLIMDNDVVNGSSEVEGVGAFFESYVNHSCIKVSFMETNAEIKQMMHHKFLVFMGPNYARTYSGAGHFTYAALRDNYENFYITNNAELANRYATLYQTMEDNSQTYSQASGQ